MDGSPVLVCNTQQAVGRTQRHSAQRHSAQRHSAQRHSAQALTHLQCCCAGGRVRHVAEAAWVSAGCGHRRVVRRVHVNWLGHDPHLRPMMMAVMGEGFVTAVQRLQSKGCK